ncbi:MAG: hypothetical protein V3T37_02040, partial [Syntrophobacteria bacterium]
NLKMLADLSRQLRIGITAKKFQSVQHKEKPNNPLLSEASALRARGRQGRGKLVVGHPHPVD